MSGWKPLRLFVVLLLMAVVSAQAQAAPAPQQQPVAPTYRVFATREGLVGSQTANGHIIQPRDRFVALPDRSVLSPYGTSKFQVRVTYKGRSVVAPVWDVGPWNTGDDYWSPNRRYKDLPVGLPMAQAALLDGYNGGLDESGRKIRDPNGIDLADGTFWDDLGMVRGDWVDVTFLWLGADPGPQAGAIPVNPPAARPSSARPAAVAPPPAPLDSPAVEEGATVVDSGAPGYSANQGPWYNDSCGLNGDHTWTYSTSNPAQGENLATWTPAQPLTGYFEVQVYIPGCGRVAATTGARYRVTHDGGVAEVSVNQSQAAGSWASLGIFSFGKQSAGAVELSDVAADNKRAVRFDAVAWAPRSDSTPPDARIISIARQESGYMIVWGGSDNLSGIVAYDIQVRRLPSGGWSEWKTNVAETSAWFGPDEGKHFAFRIRARDEAGNEEPWPQQADMDTACGTGQMLPGITCGP